MPKRKATVYAVKVGRRPGVYDTWEACKAQVHGFPGAKFQGFAEEAEADRFVKGESNGALKASHEPKRKKILADGAQKVDVAEGTDPLPVVVYTDGSSLGNGTNNSTAGYGVYWADPAHHSLNRGERLWDGEQTNNRGELMAILTAIKLHPEPWRPLHIHTDSQYAINCINIWMPKWKRQHWMTSKKEPVKNRDLLELIQAAMNACKYRPTFTYVRGHMGTLGNEKADELANIGARITHRNKE